MNGRIASLLVTITALTSYHLTQKAMPDNVRPAPLFAFIYGTAAIVLLGVVAIGGPETGSLGDVVGSGRHWAPWVLARSVAGIEIGYFAMYRSGWTLSSGSISVQAVVAAILVVAGLVFFKENLTAGRSVGLAMCVVGAGLVAQ